MTDLLARLRELEAAATKGPWRIGRSFKSEGPGGRGNQITPIDAKDPDCERCGHGGGQWLIAWLFKNAVAETLANAALIVAMRNALPDLLARIEALEREIEGHDQQSAE